ncbi:MAG: Allergen V5/Tpx family protein [Acidimicrobiia bacterium]|nr:Allergen V5/Tpx family protein [Acidimicrobiia bacterium]
MAVFPFSNRTGRALAVVAALAFPLVATACNPSAAPQAAGAVAPMNDQVRGLINQARAGNGAAALAVNDVLTGRAQAWAEHLASVGQLSHTADLAAGLTMHWRVLGENVGYGGNVATVCDAFLKSPSHRANVLDGRFNIVGVGVAVDGRGRTFVVQEFAAI